MQNKYHPANYVQFTCRKFRLKATSLYSYGFGLLWTALRSCSQKHWKKMGIFFSISSSPGMHALSLCHHWTLVLVPSALNGSLRVVVHQARSGRITAPTSLVGKTKFCLHQELEQHGSDHFCTQRLWPGAPHQCGWTWSEARSACFTIYWAVTIFRNNVLLSWAGFEFEAYLSR